MNRSVLRFVSRFLIASLLFLQVAVAAYACPQVSVALSAEGTKMTDCAAMEKLDQNNPGLCAEHCHVGEQASHQVEPPIVAGASGPGFVVLFPVVEALRAEPPSASFADPLVLTSAPSHAILHCCFRI